MNQTIHLITHMPEYYTWECDWNSYLLADFKVVHHYDPAREYVGEHCILVVSSSGPDQGEEKTRAQVQRFKQAGLPVGMIHLSDEWGQAPIEFYQDSAFIFRNYWRGDQLGIAHGKYFGLGWKTGFREWLVERGIEQRSLTWSFAGMMKSSRAGMLKSAQRVPGGRHISTSGFGGQGGGLGTHDYAQMMNDTVFALCPRGNTAVDCFRVYEAFEAGCIPIVEDDGGWDLAGELLWPGNFKKVEAWRRSYWRYHFKNPLQRSFWKTVYGAEFPAPRIMHWETLDTLLGSIDKVEVARRCRAWWAKYKADLRAEMARTIRTTFFNGRTDLITR